MRILELEAFLRYILNNNLVLKESTIDDIIEGYLIEKRTECEHPFDSVISCGNLHNCTKCGKNI
jgi:hypothetical protein